jgi:hypothetical protein
MSIQNRTVQYNPDLIYCKGQAYTVDYRVDTVQYSRENVDYETLTQENVHTVQNSTI